jgi:hypothetical protein
VFEAIAFAYPWLENECSRQRREREDRDLSVFEAIADDYRWLEDECSEQEREDRDL